MDQAKRGAKEGEPTRSFSFVVPLYSLLLGLLGLTLGRLATDVAGALQPRPWIEVGGLMTILVVAGYAELKYQYRRGSASLDLFEAVLATVVFVLPGLVAVVMAGVAQVLAESARRIHPRKAAFNVAQWMFATSVGSLVLELLRDGTEPSARDLPALVVAMLTLSVANFLALVGVLGLDQRLPFTEALVDTAKGIIPEGVVVTLVNLAFGVLLVATLEWAPLALPVFFIPLASLYWATRAYGSVRADRARLAGMQLATHALGVPMDPRDAIPDFLAEVRRCFESEVAELVIVQEGSRVVQRSRNHHPGEDRRVEQAGRETLAAALMRTGKAVRVTAGDGDQELPRRLREEGWRDCLAAPVRAEGKVIGVLCTYNRTGFEGFEEGELAVLDALAAEVGTAIEKGELLEAILEERTKLSEIVEHTSDGIAALDPDGTVSSWNPGFEEITGYRSADMVGSRGLARLRPRDLAGREVLLDRWADDRAPLPNVVEVLRPNG
ncbi:MAG TPA: GAF domain-containing protein, partial [Actinomycetota bacterium]|nr:GAF domain-containing protein [Actinomycetota bacterium]